MATRQLLKISKRLSLIQPRSRESWPWHIDPKSILVLFLPWLNAQEKHVRKYTEVYSNLGLDVLCMRSHVMEFLWPPQSLKTGRKLIKVLQEQCKNYDHLCVHSMSLGAYNLTSFRMLLNEAESLNYLSGKISGMIYDSVVVGAGKGGVIKSVHEGEEKSEATDALELMVTGMAKSISDNKLLFSLMNPIAKLYFVLTKSKTLDYYMNALDVVRDQPVKVPTLFMASKDDPTSDYRVMLQLADIWKNDYGVPVQIQLWDKSKHAQHIVFHRDEYLEVQRQFLAHVFDKPKV